MKREFFYYIILLFLITGLIFIEISSSNKDDVHISKVIDVQNFEKLDIDLICNIYVSIGEEQRVVLEGPEEYLNKIETELDNGILKLTESNPGIFNGFPGSLKERPVNLYLKLTSADQLIKPTKGTLITNESSLNSLMDQQQKLSINEHLRDLFRLVGDQTGFILLRPL